MMHEDSDYERAYAAALQMHLALSDALEERCAALEERCVALERTARVGFSTYRDEARDAREDADGWRRSALAKDDALGAIRVQVRTIEAALEQLREALDEGEVS